jgi:hypothetical protein
MARLVIVDDAAVVSGGSRSRESRAAVGRPGRRTFSRGHPRVDPALEHSDPVWWPGAIARPYRGSLAFRVLLYLMSIPVTLFFWFLADNSWEKYTEVGNLTVLALFMFFGLFVWWYDEDRNRRRAAKAAPENGAGSSNAGASSNGDDASSLPA